MPFDLDPFDLFDLYDACRAILIGWRFIGHARRLALVYAVDDALDLALAAPWAHRGDAG